MISLELVKVIQSSFIKKDKDLYFNERHSNVSTSSIIEELGQVDYVFSDKTGTLTCNKMEFKLCVIGDKMYGDRSVLNDKPSKPELKRKATFSDKKGGVEYTFEDKGLENDIKDDTGPNVNLKMTGVANHIVKSQSELIIEVYEVFGS